MIAIVKLFNAWGVKNFDLYIYNIYSEYYE